MTPYRKAWIPPNPKRDPLWKRIALYPLVKDEHIPAAVRAVVYSVVVLTLIMVGISYDEQTLETCGRETESLAVQTAADYFRSSRVFVQCEQHNTSLPWECYAGSPSPASGVARKLIFPSARFVPQNAFCKGCANQTRGKLVEGIMEA